MSRLRRRVADTSALFQRAPVRVRLAPFNVSFIFASCDEVFPAYSSSFHDCLNFQLLAGARERRPYSADSRNSETRQRSARPAQADCRPCRVSHDKTSRPRHHSPRASGEAEFRQ
jgi:hypothetical protein